MKKLTVNERLKSIGDILARVRNAAIFRGSERCARTGDGVDFRTPLDEVIAREEMAMADLQKETPEKICALLSGAFGAEVRLADLPGAFRETIDAAVLEQFQQYHEAFLAMLFGGGPHPLEVMRRLFAYAKMHDAGLLWNMGFRELGGMLGETHAALAARCKSVFGDAPAAWKKPASACARMKASAMGNQNRRGGKKISTKHPTNHA